MVALASQSDTKAGVSRSVLWGLGDNQGTIRDVVNNSGSVVEHRTFNAFGKPNSLAVDFLFGLDEMAYDSVAQLYQTDTRPYDPLIGRFPNEDPSGLKSDVNLYGVSWFVF
jgi:RHS repeat-associated protein